MKNILIVAAHPDDEVLGAGGVIARHSALGDEVFVLILGEGITSRYENREKALKEGTKQLANLRTERKSAHQILGIKNTIVHDLPDNRFDQVPFLDIVKLVEKTKKEVVPNIVYTHHCGDLNIDHQITFEAVLTACRPNQNSNIERLLSFEVLSSTELNAPSTNKVFLPNIFIEISPYLEKKVEAMACYKSELEEFPHPRSLEALKLNAKLWGVKSGLKAAEAFMLVREQVT